MGTMLVSKPTSSRHSLPDSEMVYSYQLFFELIGKTLYMFPTRDLFETLLCERVFEELPIDLKDPRFTKGKVLLSAWSTLQNGVLSDEEYDRLVVDDTLLFSGMQVMAAPPWESVYFNEERLVFQRETMDVRAWYRRYDLQIAQIHHEPDDHIGFEVDFLSKILACFLECDSEGDSDGSLAVFHDAITFAREHPLRWVDHWAAGVEAHAQTELYRGIALVLPVALRTFSLLA